MDYQTYPGRPKDQDDALYQFLSSPVSEDMISYLAFKATEVIRCETSPSIYKNHKFSTTPPSPQFLTDDDMKIPTLEQFIGSLVKQSNVQVSTLMTTLLYLERLRKKLPPVAKGLKCTTHRIFLTCLIITAKYVNDSSPKNRHWANYTRVESTPYQDFSEFGFSRTEVNLMEKQLLGLLDYDLNFGMRELELHFEPFLQPIRQSIAEQRAMRHRQKKAEAARRAERKRCYEPVIVDEYSGLYQTTEINNVYGDGYAKGHVPSLSDVPALSHGYVSSSGSSGVASENSSRASSRSRSTTPASSISSVNSYQDLKADVTINIDYAGQANHYTDAFAEGYPASPQQVYIAAPTHGKVQPVTVGSANAVQQPPTKRARRGMTRSTSSSLFARIFSHSERGRQGIMT